MNFLHLLLQSMVFPLLIVGPTPTPDPYQPPQPALMQATSQVSASSCFMELPPVSASGNDAVSDICTIPGQQYMTSKANGYVTLVGSNDGRRPTVWTGANEFVEVSPTDIVQASQIEFGNDLFSVGNRIQPGAYGFTGAYSMIKLSPGDPPEDVVAAGETGLDQVPTLPEKMDFASWLRSYIDDTGEGLLITFSRDGVWWDANGQVGISPRSFGCGTGDTIEWVATGPWRIRDSGTWADVVFGGHFNWPNDARCMQEFRWVKLARLMAIPGVRQRVDQARAASFPAEWNWDFGGQPESVFTWSVWRYVSFFAVRRVEQTWANATGVFVIIPNDFLDLNCSFLDGVRVCAVNSQPQTGNSP